MPNNQVRRLSDVIPAEARQGQNDKYWSLMEHQIYQAVMSLQMARLQMEKVCDAPENQEDYDLAEATLEMLTPIYVKLLGCNASVKALLSGTGVAERIGGQEGG